MLAQVPLHHERRRARYTPRQPGKSAPLPKRKSIALRRSAMPPSHHLYYLPFPPTATTISRSLKGNHMGSRGFTVHRQVHGEPMESDGLPRTLPALKGPNNMAPQARRSTDERMWPVV